MSGKAKSAGHHLKVDDSFLCYTFARKIVEASRCPEGLEAHG